MSPRRITFPLVAAALAAAALPTAASAKGGFADGVAAAEVTQGSAVLWTRATRPGKLKLEVSRDKKLRRGVKRFSLNARRASDLTVQREVEKLKAGKRYYYRFRQGGGRSEIGTFKTAPKPKQKATVEFAWTGDADPVKAPGSDKLNFAPFGVYSRMAAEGNDFNVNLGDTIYSDTDSEFEFTDPLALSVDAKRAKYRTMLSERSLRRIRAAAGMYNHWDDHEFLNDFARSQTDYPTASGTQPGQPKRIQKVDGEKLYRDGAKAFREYMPVTYSKKDGIYRTMRWGKNLEVFFLDQRSFRDAGADDGGVCDNPPGSGIRDLAPMAPQRIRNTFSLLVPSLASPPPPACVARIRDPQRTYLGSRQYAAFTKAIKRSDATFKVVMNELPIQTFYADPYDRWEGYEAERNKLLAYLKANVKNVIFLTADVHANLINDARLKTLEDGGPVDSGIMDITAGPAGTDTFADDLNDETGNPQAADLANAAFFRKPPPDGPGIQCSQLRTDSYGQVKVTSKKLTVKLIDENGKPVKDPDGKTCGPYTIKKK
ncbi:MAG TPA: alkaline phosphatase D family protein [Solirubrobacteraceae bacterium]